MGDALIIAKSEKTLDCLSEILKEENYSETNTVFSAAEAKKIVACKDFDVVFIYAPLADEVGLNLSLYMATHTNSGVFIALNKDTITKAGDKLSINGVVALEKPITSEFIHHSILAFRAMKCRIDVMKRENQKLKVQIEDIKVVNRAKCVLMQCLSMTEEQAHKYLERQAMDMRISKKQIAEQVLNTYEI